MVKHPSDGFSFLSHSSDIDDLLEGLDGVLEDWLDGLHDTESSLHIVDLWLHALDGLHLSGDLNEWLSIIESLEDSGGKGLLDVLDGSGLGNGGISITSGLGGIFVGSGLDLLSKFSQGRNQGYARFGSRFERARLPTFRSCRKVHLRSCDRTGWWRRWHDGQG